MVDKILDFLLVSSADPSKWSLTFKGFLLIGVPYALQGLSAACAFFKVCFAITQGDLEGLIDALGVVVYGVLFVVGAVVALVGFVRKLIRSAQGTNRSFDI